MKLIRGFKNMLKNAALGVETFFYGLFNGMSSAESLFHSDVSAGHAVPVMQTKRMSKSVLESLLKGEVTQEVEELRYEMYMAERESHKYHYTSSGHGEKIDGWNSASKCNAYHEEGETVRVYQEVIETVESLADSMSHPGSKFVKEYNVQVDRQVIPRFRLEEYSNHVSICITSGKDVIVDFYASMYPSQFNRMHVPFLNAMEEITGGYSLSDILDIDGISFTTYKASGDDDLKIYKVSDMKYYKTVTYNGNYVVRFMGHLDMNGADVLDEFRNEAIEAKFRNKERRKNATADFSIAAAKMECDKESEEKTDAELEKLKELK